MPDGDARDVEWELQCIDDKVDNVEREVDDLRELVNRLMYGRVVWVSRYENKKVVLELGRVTRYKDGQVTYVKCDEAGDSIGDEEFSTTCVGRVEPYVGVDERCS